MSEPVEFIAEIEPMLLSMMSPDDIENEIFNMLPGLGDAYKKAGKGAIRVTIDTDFISENPEGAE